MREPLRVADGTEIPRIGVGRQPSIGTRTAAGMRKASKRATTPEMRLLVEHYDLMGEDDEKRLAKLDPRQHKYGCRCLQCDQDIYPCPVDECDLSSVGKVRAASHLEWHKQRAKLTVARGRRVHERMLKPAGLDFVTQLLGDPVKSSRIDVREIRLLHERLFGQVKIRTTSMRAMRNRLEDLLRADAPAKGPLPLTAPKEVAIVVMRLALLSGTPPATVTAALLAWGIEKFTADIKAMRAVSPVHVSTALTTPRPPTPSAQFPQADEAMEA